MFSRCTSDSVDENYNVVIQIKAMEKTSFSVTMLLRRMTLTFELS